jgi:asparagine N-glycosylation enzyme membrane subunit Stt3
MGTGTVLLVIVFLALFIWALRKNGLKTNLSIAAFFAVSTGLGMWQWNQGIGIAVTILGVALGVGAYFAPKKKTT